MSFAGPINTSTPIVVIRHSRAEFQHGVLAVARSAGRLGIPVYAIRRERHEPALRSRYLTGEFEVPAGASSEEWLERLLALGERLGRPMLLAVEDESPLFTAVYQQRLAEQFLIPAQPEGLAARLTSKRGLWELCSESGVPTPRSSFPADERELLEQVGTYGYPVVLKRSEPTLPAYDPDAPSVAIAHTREQLLAAYRRMESPVRPHVMLQEHIPGRSETVWMFNGYFGQLSECLCAFTARKLRQWPPRTGPTSLGVCETNAQVIAEATALLRAVGYRGIVDMGFRYDERDGRYKLLDVNPRIGNSFRLFVGENGLDVLRAQYLDLTGQAVPASAARDGRKWVNEAADLRSSVQLAREGTLGAGAWLRSVRAIDEAAWWAGDDPLPFLAMCARTPVRVWRSAAPDRDSRRATGAGSPVSRTTKAGAHRQTVIDRYFDERALFWRDIYGEEGLQGLIYRQRMERALGWIEELAAPRGGAALDVGCGAGLLTVELATRGFGVIGIDTSAEMLELAAARLATTGVTEAARVQHGDVHALPFATGQFGLVVALGLLPWVPDPQRAVMEMARVLAPGGLLVLSADNQARLNALAGQSPLLEPPKRLCYAFMRARGRRIQTRSRLHWPWTVDRFAATAGLRSVRRATVGFGPLTLLGRELLPDSTSLRLHGRLQALSDRDAPVVRWTGWHYLLAARKPGGSV